MVYKSAVSTSHIFDTSASYIRIRSISIQWRREPGSASSTQMPRGRENVSRVRNLPLYLAMAPLPPELGTLPGAVTMCPI